MDNVRTLAGPSLSVRRLGPKDVPAYAELLLGLDSRDRAERFLAPMSDREMHSYSMRLFMTNAPILGASENGHLVGAIDVGADESGVADIGLVVADGYRRRGHGRRLLQAGLDLCAAYGIEDVYFDCYFTNQAMVDLASEFGFRELCRDRPSTYHRSTSEPVATEPVQPASAVVIDFQTRRRMSA